jgi:class 3 adenylate cyclase
MGTFHLGPAAITYAVRQPEKVSKLILYGTFGHGSDLTTEAVKDSLVGMVRSHWGIARRMLADIVSSGVSNEMLERIANDEGDSADSETVARLIELSYGVDVRDLLPSIKAPTLVLHRRGDRAVPFRMGRELALHLGNARFIPLDGALHYPWFGDSESVARPILDFLDDSYGSRAKVSTVDANSGTAIILFADVVDSTRLTEELGDTAFREKARTLDEAMRAIIREHSGTCIDAKTLGDGVLATFTSAAKAIEAALACGKAGSDGGLALHLGIHAGDVIREENNVFGGAVNISARISSLSAPGQLLVSDTVRSLARTSAGVVFEDLGEQALKGIADPVRLFKVDPS